MKQEDIGRKLIDATIHVIANNGLENATTKRIGVETGINEAYIYTEDAVQYLGEYLAAKNKLTKQKKLVTEQQKKEFLAGFDWNRMTAQDERVWQAIFDCLDN